MEKKSRRDWGLGASWRADDFRVMDSKERRAWNGALRTALVQGE